MVVVGGGVLVGVTCCVRLDVVRSDKDKYVLAAVAVVVSDDRCDDVAVADCVEDTEAIEVRDTILFDVRVGVFTQSSTRCEINVAHWYTDAERVHLVPSREFLQT